MNDASIEITLNGKPMALPYSMTLTQLAAFLQIDTGTIALGRNAEVVPKSQFGETYVSAGDQIDVVQFVAGG
ncbi:MAG TPA: sulfur carrier protein ThiS [Bdellovibrionota bacterium]|nr:sulfur carrier protein ThiS [Bdellovibrionota bacterium]